MMIELCTEEQDLLIELVDRRIEDLGPEIRRCRAHVYHDTLKELRNKLKALRNRLAAVSTENV